MRGIFLSLTQEAVGVKGFLFVLSFPANSEWWIKEEALAGGELKTEH